LGVVVPTLGEGEDIVSTLPGTKRTTLNYDLIPTTPTEQRKCLRKGGFCWDRTFVLSEHVAHAASAEWNGDGGGGGGGGAGTATRKRVVDLRASMGLCGLMTLMGPDCTV
jgi:hypothetical protein